MSKDGIAETIFGAWTTATIIGAPLGIPLLTSGAKKIEAANNNAPPLAPPEPQDEVRDRAKALKAAQAGLQATLLTRQPGSGSGSTGTGGTPSAPTGQRSTVG